MLQMDFLNQYPENNAIDDSEMRINYEHFHEKSVNVNVLNSPEYIREEEIELDFSFDSSDEELKTNNSIESNSESFNLNNINLRTKVLPVECQDSSSNNNLVATFINKIKSAYSQLPLLNYNSGVRIFNLDEIPLTVKHHFPLKIKRNELRVTACCCISAVGDSLPPYLIFPRTVFKDIMLKGGPKGSYGTGIKSGNINEYIFIDVLHHFQKHFNATLSDIVILIVKYKDYHISPKATEFCQEQGILLITLPEDSVILHPFQSLSRTIRKEFKKAYYNFKHRNNTKSIKIYDIAPLFNSIYKVVFDPSKIKMAFENTGFWPLNVKKFEQKLPCLKQVSERKKVSKLKKKRSSNIKFQKNTDCKNIVVLKPRKINYKIEYIKPEEITNFVKEETEEFDSNLVSEEIITTNDANTHYTECNKTPIEEFIDNLTFAYNQLDDYNPQKIFNLDEIEFIASVGTASGFNEKIKISVCCFISASGNSFPPFLICPEEHFYEDLLIYGPEESKFSTTKNGLINEEIFVEILQHFQHHVRATVENPIVLILDTEESHITIKSLDFCRESGIILVTVPPHISVPLQPLEKTVFQTLKADFHREYENFINSNEAITVSSTIWLFSCAYRLALNPSNIIEGFQIAGVWPLDHSQFMLDKLCSTYTENHIAY